MADDLSQHFAKLRSGEAATEAAEQREAELRQSSDKIKAALLKLTDRLAPLKSQFGQMGYQAQIYPDAFKQQDLPLPHVNHFWIPIFSGIKSPGLLLVHASPSYLELCRETREQAAKVRERFPYYRTTPKKHSNYLKSLEEIPYPSGVSLSFDPDTEEYFSVRENSESYRSVNYREAFRSKDINETAKWVAEKVAGFTVLPTPYLSASPMDERDTLNAAVPSIRQLPANSTTSTLMLMLVLVATIAGALAFLLS